MSHHKKIFRDKIKKNILSITSKHQKEFKILSHFKRFVHKKEIKYIISYFPDKYEVNPSLLLPHGAKVFFPSIVNQKLYFVHPNSLRKGKYNILEPVGNEKIDPHDADLCIVPSLGINPEGYRLGRGGGFYDRTFEGIDVLKLGLGFDESHICDFQEEVYDMKFSFFITSEGILEF